ncbi:MAG TPA: 5'/3'-nucleotidase SurE [Dehalococcoidales bacterium]
MNILVTNDDGINSPGIWALAEALSKVGNVLMVAPEKQQSGVGTSVSFLRENVTITEVPTSIPGVKAYAVSGTPSDCVIIGLRQLAQAHIDLLVSGINYGPNVGHDIPYSGTVMATLGGYFRKIPSMAVSLSFRDQNVEMRFDIAARFAASIAENIKNGTMQTEAILNVNVPSIPPELIKGVRVTRTADFGYVRLGDAIGKSAISHEVKIGNPAETSTEDNTDVWAINAGYISITPLHLDVTHHALIPTIAEKIQGLDWGLQGNK